jgi:hypothetical protein
MSPVLDVVMIALLTLHEVMNGTRRSVLAIVVKTMSELLLFALTVALNDVAASVVAAPILLEVGA